MSYQLGDIREIRAGGAGGTENTDPRHQYRRVPVTGPIQVVPLKQRGAWSAPRGRRAGSPGLGAMQMAATFAPAAGSQPTLMPSVIADMLSGKNPLVELDNRLAQLIRDTPGATAAIDAIQPVPVYYPQFKADLKARPVSALFNLLKPIQNIAQDTIRNALSIGGITTLNLAPPGAPANNVQMGLTVPSSITNPTHKEAVIRLQLLKNFMVLAWLRPQHLAAGFVKALVDQAARSPAEMARIAGELDTLLMSIRDSGFSLGATAKPGQSFINALASELRRLFPNLGMFAVAQDTLNVVSFWHNFVVLMFGKIGIYTDPRIMPVLNYQLACIRIEKDRTDSGVQWEIANVKGTRPEQNDGQNDASSLRGLQRRGDALGWNHPVFNAGLRALLDQAKSDLDNVSQNVASLYNSDYKQYNRRATTMPGIPGRDHKNLWKMGQDRGAPTTILSGNAFSANALKYLKDAGKLSGAKTYAMDSARALCADAKSFFGGLGAILSQILSAIGLPSLDPPANPTLPGLGSLPVRNFRMGEAATATATATGTAGSGAASVDIAALSEALGPILVPIAVAAFTAILAAVAPQLAGAVGMGTAADAERAANDAVAAKDAAARAQQEAAAAKATADQAQQAANAAKANADTAKSATAAPARNQQAAQQVGAQAVKAKQDADTAKANADAAKAAAQAAAGRAATAADAAKAAEKKTSDAAQAAAQTEMLTQLAVQTGTAAVQSQASSGSGGTASGAASKSGVSGWGWLGAVATGSTGSTGESARAAAAVAKAQAASQAAQASAQTAAQTAQQTQVVAQGVAQTAQQTLSTIDSMKAWLDKYGMAVAVGGGIGLAVVGLGVAAYFLMSKKGK